MLNWADIVLLAIVALSTLVGLWRGFIVEALSLGVWAVAFWVAFQFGKPVSELFEGHIDTPSARLFLAHAMLFIGALVAGGLVTWLVGRLVAGTGLSGTDRLLGLLFGLVRGAALGCLLVLLLGFTPLPRDPWWQESRLLPGFQRGAEWMKSWLPDAAAQYVRFGADELPAPRAPTGE
ncbi:CvpA family protein [Rehaibacterium terrae]|jgi:membrane protein required for colicin V production|uniref:Membrane protein required for colicin V production n=1 Tax=Rehaibacterium terrae TaxID=1341696 RepID=A0A7W8DEM8_9GAMM|nr:CvpA family protein [Rehaibacterium terrae]MBB5015813.1 membrane protein required for colicin V production [Rehaibacterium terrae]